MDEIGVAINWADINHAKISRLLAKRFYGWFPVIFIPLVTIAAFVLLTIALKSYVGPKAFSRGISLAILPVFVAFFIHGRLNTHWKKKLVRAMHSAPIRQGIQSVILTPDGIISTSSLIVGSISWSKITEVIEMPDTTLVLFSPIEYIPLPDSGLPAGLTRAALLDQVAKWRGMALNPT